MTTHDDSSDSPERRGLDRRVEMLEREIRQMETQSAVMQATLNGLVSSMDSRHRAFERGQDLILERLEKVTTLQRKQESDLTTLANAPHDLSKTTLSSSSVAAIVLTVVGIIGGQIASTWGLRSDIRDIGSRQTMQADLDRGTQKLQEERALALRGAVDAVDKNQKLQQLEIQNLRETVLKQRSP